MLKFNLSGITKAALGLERFRRSMVTTASNAVREQIVGYAALSKAPNGSQWPALTPAYKRRKEKLGLGGVANKRGKNNSIATIINRNGVVAPASDKQKQWEGLEKKRVSFEVAPNTATIVETLLLKSFNAAS